MKDLKNLSLEELKKMASKNKIEGRSKMNKEELIKNLKNNNMKGGMINENILRNIEHEIFTQGAPPVQLWKYDPQSDVIMRPLGFVKGIGQLGIYNDIVPLHFHQFKDTINPQNYVINISVITSLNNINMSLYPRGGKIRIFALAKNLYYFDVAGTMVLVIYSNEDTRNHNNILKEIKNQFRINTSNVKRIRVTQPLNEVGRGVNFNEMYENFYENN
jgi:hypothetical protein